MSKKFCVSLATGVLLTSCKISSSSLFDEAEKSQAAPCTEKHDPPDVSSLMYHVPRLENHGYETLINNSSFSVGLSLLDGKVGVGRTYNFKTTVETDVHFVFAYHTEGTQFFKDDGVTINLGVDERDRFVAECHYTISVSTDRQNFTSINVLGSGSQLTEEEVKKMSASKTEGFVLDPGDSMETQKQECIRVFNDKYKSVVDKDLADMIRSNWFDNGLHAEKNWDTMNFLLGTSDQKSIVAQPFDYQELGSAGPTSFRFHEKATIVREADGSIKISGKIASCVTWHGQFPDEFAQISYDYAYDVNRARIKGDISKSECPRIHEFMDQVTQDMLAFVK